VSEQELVTLSTEILELREAVNELRGEVRALAKQLEGIGGCCPVSLPWCGEPPSLAVQVDPSTDTTADSDMSYDEAVDHIMAEHAEAWEMLADL